MSSIGIVVDAEGNRSNDIFIFIETPHGFRWLFTTAHG